MEDNQQLETRKLHRKLERHVKAAYDLKKSKSFTEGHPNVAHELQELRDSLKSSSAQLTAEQNKNKNLLLELQAVRENLNSRLKRQELISNHSRKTNLSLKIQNADLLKSGASLARNSKRPISAYHSQTAT